MMTAQVAVIYNRTCLAWWSESAVSVFVPKWFVLGDPVFRKRGGLGGLQIQWYYTPWP
jgi:hypothetical protein